LSDNTAMPPTHRIYLEVGSKRVFAGALDWPGWCRSGRDEASSLLAVAAYGERYGAAIGRTAGFTPPPSEAVLRVVERLKGNATTDFGVPGVAPPSDEEPLGPAETKRLVALLKACWATFDRTAKTASGRALRKGPRGGGRDLDAIVRHVLDGEQAYLAKLGGKWQKPVARDGVTAEMGALRKELIQLFTSRASGEPPPRTPRSGSLWVPRYFVRRSAWHALDHAWEIEDRSLQS
jgi:hypothetical protein